MGDLNSEDDSRDFNWSKLGVEKSALKSEMVELEESVSRPCVSYNLPIQSVQQQNTSSSPQLYKRVTHP